MEPNIPIEFTDMDDNSNFGFNLSVNPSLSITEPYIPTESTDEDDNSNLGFDLNVDPNLSMMEGQFWLDLNLEPIGEEDGMPQLDLNLEPNMEDDDTLSELEQDDSITNKRKTLSNAERIATYQLLLQKSVNGKLTRGVTKEVSSILSIPVRTIQRLWQRAKSSSTGDVASLKTSNCGRKRIHVDMNQMRAIPFHKRTTLQSVACSMNISKTRVVKLLKEGSIRRHSNSIKPFLKELNKISRLQFCISMLDENSLPHDPLFKGMHNIIHIDEKWFYMTKNNENYYLLPDEEEPLRTCKSKNFIVKVMFLAAIARPRFDSQGNQVFSGKIGMFPLVKQEPAKRSSVNRVADTLETKPITSVTRDVIRSYLIGKVLPAIKEKWPSDDLMHPIVIQQDNAKTHIDPNDHEFCEAVRQAGLNIRIMCQPANSPDLNVLDLGFFRAIQSIQYQEAPKTVGDLVQVVVKSFEDFSVVKSNHIFLSLQQSMIEIMKIRGGHGYKLKHMNKSRLEREGRLPVQLNCSATLVQDAQQFLN